MSLINIFYTYLNSIWSLFDIYIPYINMKLSTLTISIMVIKFIIDLIRNYMGSTLSSINSSVNKIGRKPRNERNKKNP